MDSKRAWMRLPSPSMAVALLALVIAASGTAVAAGTLVKGDTLIKQKSLSGNRIKSHTITGKQIKPSKLGTVPKATTATNAGNATNAANATNAGHASNADHATNADTAVKANSLPAVTWHPITLETGWSSSTGAFGGDPSYTKDTEGFVHLAGAPTGPNSNGSLIGVLPTGFRPPQGAWVALGSTSGVFDPKPENLWVDSDGNMRAYLGTGATNGFVSLAGVTFYAGN